MTKKNFVGIAEAINLARLAVERESKSLAGILYCVDEISRYCKKVNPDFDSERFYFACGLTLSCKASNGYVGINRIEYGINDQIVRIDGKKFDIVYTEAGEAYYIDEAGNQEMLNEYIKIK